MSIYRVAMGQINRSTKRISSFVQKRDLKFFLLKFSLTFITSMSKSVHDHTSLHRSFP